MGGQRKVCVNVQDVADSCRTGAATNIIFGLALGYKSAIIPCIVIAVAIFISFTLASMFGIACAALGMLTTLATGEEHLSTARQPDWGVATLQMVRRRFVYSRTVPAWGLHLRQRRRVARTLLQAWRSTPTDRYLTMREALPRWREWERRFASAQTL